MQLEGFNLCLDKIGYGYNGRDRHKRRAHLAPRSFAPARVIKFLDQMRRKAGFDLLWKSVVVV
jgi:hypothetical protein